MDSLPVRTIDGSRFDDLEGFWDEVSRELVPGSHWARNLDAFNDILRGGFGTPEGGFVLRWVNADRSKEALGHAETGRWLERKLQRCHPSNVPSVRSELADARVGKGPTLFDVLVEIVRDHGEGGDENADRVCSSWSRSPRGTRESGPVDPRATTLLPVHARRPRTRASLARHQCVGRPS